MKFTPTEAQIEGRACWMCGAEDQPMHPFEGVDHKRARLVECVDTEACLDRRLTVVRLRRESR